MEINVKWVYQEVHRHGVPVQAGQKPALCFKARKYMLCVAAGYPVRVLKRPVKDYETSRLVVHAGQDYPISLAVQQLLRIGEKNGITEGARKLLQKAVGTVNDVNEEEFTDEENIMLEKPGDQVDSGSAQVGDNEDTQTQEVPPVKTKKAKSAPKTKAKAKSAAPKKERGNRGPSKISKAVEYMREEIKKEGGMKELERGYRKDLFKRAADKFGLSPITCSIQYNKQILNGKK